MMIRDQHNKRLIEKKEKMAVEKDVESETYSVEEDSINNDSNENIQELTNAKNFRKRLETFHTSKYFAKPKNISPLICARFGWTNPSKDLLVCQNPKCRQSVYIFFHNCLSRTKVDELSQKYLQMLCTSHKESCVFYQDAYQWLCLESSIDSTSISDKSKGEVSGDHDKNEINEIPQYLYSVVEPTRDLSIFENSFFSSNEANSSFSTDLLTLFHVLEKQDLFQSYLMKGGESSTRSSTPNSGDRYRLQLSIPSQMYDLIIQGNSHLFPNPKKIGVKYDVLQELHNLLLSAAPSSSFSYKESNSIEALILSLCGWTPMKVMDCSESQKCGLLIKCNVCSAQNIIPLVTEHEKENQEKSLPSEHNSPSNKRQKTRNSSPSQINPLMAHKFFCPYVCNLTAKHQKSNSSIQAAQPNNNKPGWQTILLKLLQTISCNTNKSKETPSQPNTITKPSQKKISKTKIGSDDRYLSLIPPANTPTKENGDDSYLQNILNDYINTCKLNNKTSMFLTSTTILEETANKNNSSNSDDDDRKSVHEKCKVKEEDVLRTIRSMLRPNE